MARRATARGQPTGQLSAQVAKASEAYDSVATGFASEEEAERHSTRGRPQAAAQPQPSAPQPQQRVQVQPVPAYPQPVQPLHYVQPQPRQVSCGVCQQRFWAPPGHNIVACPHCTSHNRVAQNV